MDLGAFLKPGAICSVKISAPEHPQEGSVAPGYLINRRGHPLWALSSPQPIGRKVAVTVFLPGYGLASDGSLEAAADSAQIILLGRVTGCRFFGPKGLYILRLELLGRVFE